MLILQLQWKFNNFDSLWMAPDSLALNLALQFVPIEFVAPSNYLIISR